MTRVRWQSPSPAARIRPGILPLAERIIRGATRERPADGVLRAELRAQRGLSREEGAQVSKAVFAYFRWRGWLDEEKPIREQVEHALALAKRYAAQPESFNDAELMARAVPGWLPSVMEPRAAWARSLQKEPRLWLRARRGQGRALAGKLVDCRVFGEGPLADTLEYIGRSDLFRTRGISRGGI